jgi:hypothetical protein
MTKNRVSRPSQQPRPICRRYPASINTELREVQAGAQAMHILAELELVLRYLIGVYQRLRLVQCGEHLFFGTSVLDRLGREGSDLSDRAVAFAGLAR